MRFWRLFLTVLLLGGLLAAPLHAEGDSGLYPQVPEAVGSPHPEGNEFWRKNHMDLLRHDRDLTLRLGDRTVDASLKSCLVCHAVTGPDAAPVPAGDAGGFCAVCHAYAAVRIDCFTCHKATPDEDGLDVLNQARVLGDTEEAAQLIADYLQKLQSGIQGGAPPTEVTQ